MALQRRDLCMQFREESQGCSGAMFSDRFPCFSALGGDAGGGVADEGWLGTLTAEGDKNEVGCISI